MLNYSVEIVAEFRAATIAGGFTHCEHMHTVSAYSLPELRDFARVEEVEKHVVKLCKAQGRTISDLAITFNYYDHNTYNHVGVCRIAEEYGAGPSWRVITWPRSGETNIDKREKITAKDARACYLLTVEKIEQLAVNDSTLSA